MITYKYRLLLFLIAGLTIILFGGYVTKQNKILGLNSCSSCQGNLWFIGRFTDRFGLDFSSGGPTLIEDIEFYTQEASAVITDENDELLFSTNGNRAWNKNHELMPSLDVFQGGTPLEGHPSTVHVLVLPQPGHDSLYYIFHPDPIETLFEDSIKKMTYSVINMNLENGLGEFQEKNVLLFQESTEKVAGIRHCNGEDWWVLTHEKGNNKFRCWLLDEMGISLTSIDSEVGIGNAGTFISMAGSMKISPNGEYLATTTPDDSGSFPSSTNFTAHLELFKFDNATGQVEELVTLQDSLMECYGVSFSPDNSKIYSHIRKGNPNYYGPFTILQYDLSSDNPQDILDSKFVVDSTLVANKGQFEIAPNGKIYITNSTFSIFDDLDVIHNPNEYGEACNYEELGFSVQGHNTASGLPTFPAGYFAPAKPWLIAPLEVCLENTLTQLYVTGNCTFQDYDWEVLGNGNISSTLGDTAWVNFTSVGQQQVAVHRTTACGVRSDTVKINVIEQPESIDTVQLCYGDSILVFGDWVSTSGSFSEIYDNNKCDSIAQIIVMVNQEIEADFDILSPCEGEATGNIVAIVSGGNPPFQFAWSTGSTDDILSNIPAGNYELTITDDNGCQKINSVEITPNAIPDVIITSIENINCAATSNGSVEIEVSGGTPPYSILWNDSAQQTSLIASNLSSGTYEVSITDINGCMAILSNIVIDEIVPEIQITNLVNQAITLGTELVLNPIISGGTPPFNFEWTVIPNDSGQLSCIDCPQPVFVGEQSSEIILFVTDINGCNASTMFQITVNDSKLEDGIYAPNVFSPNGDMINDYFNIFSSKGDISNLSIKIFDRWGELIFENKDILPNEESAGWDGVFNGELMNPQVFIWQAEVQFLSGERKVFYGDVMLMR
jgi:gliding motility-associated-like protein